MENLELYKSDFSKCLEGKYENDFWAALHNTINQFNLTPKYFFDLLSAFRQDISTARYNSIIDLLNYCERSANPVGRIILEFFTVRDEQSLKYSDAVCTALQLTNFYQDISIDIKKKRIYIPLDELAKFGVSENQFELMENNTNFEQLVSYQVERVKKLFVEGRKLIDRLPKQLKRQIYMTILGGEMILFKIEKSNFGVIDHRPKLSVYDYCKIFTKTFFRL